MIVFRVAPGLVEPPAEPLEPPAEPLESPAEPLEPPAGFEDAPLPTPLPAGAGGARFVEELELEPPQPPASAIALRESSSTPIARMSRERSGTNRPRDVHLDWLVHDAASLPHRR